MSFERVLRDAFPGSMSEERFIGESLRVTAPLGFHAENTLACVGVCRDELCQPLVNEVHRSWGHAFLLAGLGGMLSCGRTGMRAAHGHAPVRDQRERYAYICMPHIGIGPDGEPGACVRPTRDEVSTACGALVGLHQELSEGRIETDELDHEDLEQSLLARRLTKELTPDAAPDLVDLTKLARQAIATDLERLIAQTVDPTRADYCVFSGVQIHAPDGRTFVWPATAYAVVDGRRRDLGLEAGSRS